MDRSAVQGSRTAHRPWRSIRAAPARVAVVVAVLALTGCADVQTGLTLHIGAVTETAGRRPLGTHEETFRRASAIVKELGLPVPEEYVVHVYPSRERFREGLVRDAAISPARAEELAAFALGVGKRRLLLFNEEGAPGFGREWVRLVAHEVTHLAQFELTGGEGRGEQWLAEGMAEWVAFTVLERLGLDRLERRRRVATVAVRDHPRLAAGALDLEVLGTPRGFTRGHQRDGAMRTYQLSFLLADRLIQTHGLDGVIAYFRSFQEHGDRHRNFEHAFGQPLVEFEADAVAALGGVWP